MDWLRRLLGGASTEGEASAEAAEKSASARADTTHVDSARGDEPRNAGDAPPQRPAHGRRAGRWEERSAPGVAALLDGVAEDGSHSILDLGTAAPSSLGIYGRYGRRVRFAEVLDAARSAEGWPAALRALPPQPEDPYDLVFAWDILDRLYPQERPRLVEHLVRITRPGARLHAVVESSERSTTTPLRYAVLDEGRVQYQPVGPPRPAREPLLPAEVERLLAPFEVDRAFTLKGGLREYVAIYRRE